MRKHSVSGIPPVFFSQFLKPAGIKVSRQHLQNARTAVNMNRHGHQLSMPPSMPPPVHSRIVVIKSEESWGKERFTITDTINSTAKYKAPIAAPQKNFRFPFFFPVINPAKKDVAI